MCSGNLSKKLYLIHWIYPPTQDASHHQDDITSLAGNPYEIDFQLLLGGGRSNYTDIVIPPEMKGGLG